MAARDPPQMIEEEREWAEVPTPLLEGLIRLYRGSGGGECTAAELPLVGLLRASPLRRSLKVSLGMRSVVASLE
jgi:hypothetical protein